MTKRHALVTEVRDCVQRETDQALSRAIHNHGLRESCVWQQSSMTAGVGWPSATR